jgi:hypothetical protein
MFAQGGQCFFCKKSLAKNEASVEYLVASANGGRNDDENCAACCKSINKLLGSMSLKEKIQVVLNQRGHFKCPNDGPKMAVPTRHGSGSGSKKLSGHEVTSLLEQLGAQGLIVVNGTKVSYAFPQTSA